MSRPWNRQATPRHHRVATAVRGMLRILDDEVPALPLDLFRALLGAIFFAYFLHLLLQAEDFSAEDGLVDHRLILEVFWYTRLGLFQPGISLLWLQAAFACACLAALAFTAGFHVRLSAASMFLVAVSAYRWNFLVMYFDDAVIHLMLMWALLLPMGQTLVLGEWLNQGPDAWRKWRSTVVPGGSTRCFLWNLTLVYFVAGVWKLGSPMWREGTALYVALQTPAAWTPRAWSGDYAGWLVPMNYLALGFELAFPLFLVLPRNHPVKWAMLPAMVGFHAGTIATLRVPYSNAALLASVVILFRHELMDRFGVVGTAFGRPSPPPAFRLRTVLSFALVALLTISVVRVGDGDLAAGPAGYGVEELGMDPRGVGGLTFVHKPVYAMLWSAGIAQEYQLFDWIDSRNYALSNEVVESGRNGWRRLDPASVFPQSVRGALLQAYLHDLVWVHLPRQSRDQVRGSLIERFARRFCRDRGTSGTVVARSSVRRIQPDGLPDAPDASRVVLRFRCNSGQVRFFDVSRSA